MPSQLCVFGFAVVHTVQILAIHNMNHFSACPEPLLDMLFEQSDIQHMMDQIRKHQNIAERLCELLSALSADVYSM